MGGGWGVVAADEVARSGLLLAELSNEVIGEIDRVLPPYWSRGNPVVGGEYQGWSGREGHRSGGALGRWMRWWFLESSALVTSPLRVIDEVKRVQERSGMYVGGSLPDPEKYRFREGDFIKWVAELMRAYRKPIINVSVRPIQRAVFGEEFPFSTVVLPSPLRSVRVIAKMYKVNLPRPAGSG